MYLEAVEMIADWVKDPSNGVNAMLAGLTDKLAPGDVPPPQVKTIQDESRNVEVIKRMEPQNVPALYIMLEEPILVDAIDPTGVQQRIRELPISMRYITREAEPVKVRRHTMYTLRALLMSMNNLNLPDYESNRLRRSVCLEAIVSTAVLGDIIEKVGDVSSVTGAVIITWSAVDTAPK